MCASVRCVFASNVYAADVCVCQMCVCVSNVCALDVCVTGVHRLMHHSYRACMRACMWSVHMCMGPPATPAVREPCESAQAHSGDGPECACIY